MELCMALLHRCPACLRSCLQVDLNCLQTDSLGARRNNRSSACSALRCTHFIIFADLLYDKPSYRSTRPPRRLGEAEQLLETCACSLLGLGFNQLDTLYRQIGRKVKQPDLMQGDLLLRLFASALRHDYNYMAANMVYCGNRDRVITMGQELHEKALALHHHRPEFTLIYPEGDAKARRKPVRPPSKYMRPPGSPGGGSDSSDSEIPSPRPKSPTQLLREEAELRTAADRTGTPDVKSRPTTKVAQLVASLATGVSSLGTGRSALAASTPSKSSLIKLEMMGQSGEAGGGSGPASPATPTLRKAQWLPKAATLDTISWASRTGSPRAGGAPSPTAGIGPQSPEPTDAGHRSVSRLRGETAAWRPSGSGFGSALGSAPASPSPSPSPPRGRFQSHAAPRRSSPGDARPSRSRRSRSGRRRAATTSGSEAALPSGNRPPSATSPFPCPSEVPPSDASASRPTTAQSPTRGNSSPAPAGGYAWFPGSRLFTTIEDVPVPPDVPSMLDLEHTIQRFLSEGLLQYFALPLMPAIIMTDWGLPPSDEHLSTRSVAAPSAEASIDPAGTAAAAPGTAAEGEASALGMEGTHGSEQGSPGKSGNQEEGEGDKAAAGADEEPQAAAAADGGGGDAKREQGDGEGSGLFGSDEEEDEEEGEEEEEEGGSLSGPPGAQQRPGRTPPSGVPPLALGLLHGGQAGEGQALTSGLLAAAFGDAAASSKDSAREASTHRSPHLSEAMEQYAARMGFVKAAPDVDTIGEDKTSSGNREDAAATMVALSHREEIVHAGEKAEQAIQELEESRKAKNGTVGGEEEEEGEEEEGRGEEDGEAGEDGDEAAAAAAGEGGAEEEQQEELQQGTQHEPGQEHKHPAIDYAAEAGAAAAAAPSTVSHPRPSKSSSKSALVGRITRIDEGPPTVHGAAAADTDDAAAAEAALAAAFANRDAVSGILAGRRRAAVARPEFVPSARMIDIFLGGHMRGAKHRRTADGTGSEAGGGGGGSAASSPGPGVQPGGTGDGDGSGAVNKPATPLLPLDPALHLRSDSVRDRTLLDGYDLQAELDSAKVTKEHVPGLTSEMRALEAELASVMGRKKPHRPKHHKHRHHRHGESRLAHSPSGSSHRSYAESSMLSQSSYQDEADHMSTIYDERSDAGGSGDLRASGGSHEYPPRGSTADAAALSPGRRQMFGPDGAPLPPRSASAPTPPSPSRPPAGPLSPSAKLALAGEKSSGQGQAQGGQGGQQLGPWGATLTSSQQESLSHQSVVPYGESVRLSVRLRDYKPGRLSGDGTGSLPSVGGSPMAMAGMSAASRRAFGATVINPAEIFAALAPAPAPPHSTMFIDPALVFPERPGTVGSHAGGGYPDSVGSSNAATAALFHLADGDAERGGVGGDQPGGDRATSRSAMGDDGAADLLFLTGLGMGGPGNGNAHAKLAARRRTNLRGGGQALKPLSEQDYAAAGTAAAAAAASPLARVPSTGAAPAPSSASGPPPAPARSRPASSEPSARPAPLAPVPTEVLEADPEAAYELEALRLMWSSRPYTHAENASLRSRERQAAEEEAAAEAVHALIAQAEEDGWRQYEEGASRFIEELASTLARQDQQQQQQQREGDAAEAQQGGAGSPPGRGTHSLMKALAVMEDHLAAGIDPSKLTGLSMQDYSKQMSSMMSRLMVAPLATRFLFWKKVQSLGALKQRLMEDRELERQLREVAWVESFEPVVRQPPSGAWVRERSAAGPQRGEDAAAGPPPAPAAWPGLDGLGAGGLEAHRAAWVPAGPLPPRGASQPLRSSQIVLKPRDDTPAALRAAQQRDAIAAFFVRSADDEAAAAASRAHRQQQLQQISQQQHSQHQQQLQPATLFMSAEDAAQLSAPSQRDVLLRAQHELLEQRRAMSAALEDALASGPEAMLYAPTLDEEEAVVGRLAEVTVALHQETLKRAHRVSGDGRAGGGAAFGRGAPVPQWLRDDVAGAPQRDGFQASPDPWVSAAVFRPGGPSAQAAAGGQVVSSAGLARPHASAASVGELAVLAAGISGGKIASAALRPAGGGVNGGAATSRPGEGGDGAVAAAYAAARAGLPSPQGQGRPLRGPAAVPSPLAPLVNPPAFPAAATQPGNVQLPLPRLTAHVERGGSPKARPSALSASAAPLSARSRPSRPSVSPTRRGAGGHSTLGGTGRLQSQGISSASSTQQPPMAEQSEADGPWAVDPVSADEGDSALGALQLPADAAAVASAPGGSAAGTGLLGPVRESSREHSESSYNGRGG